MAGVREGKTRPGVPAAVTTNKNNSAAGTPRSVSFTSLSRGGVHVFLLLPADEPPAHSPPINGPGGPQPSVGLMGVSEREEVKDM